MVRALTGLGHQVDLLTLPAGRRTSTCPGLRHRRSLRLPVGRVRAGRLARQAAARRAVHGRGRLARMAVRPLRRGARGRGGGAPRGAVRPPARPAPGGGRGLVDPGPAPLLGLRARAARCPGWPSASSATPCATPAAVITVCTSLTEGVRARAPQARRVPDRGPAAGRRERAPAPETVAALRARAAASARGRSSSTRATSSPTRASTCSSTRRRRVPEAQFLFMGGEPAEIEALRARGRGLGRRRALRLRGQAPAGRAAAASSPWPTCWSRPAPRARTRRSRSTPTWPRAGRSWPRASPPTPSSSTTRWRFLVEPTPAGLAAGHPRRRWRDPAEAARRGPARGRALIEREYSPARYAEKVEEAYAAVSGR